MRYVIIGNGIAGIQAAETIRQIDDKGSITIIGDETFTPYCRPMISLVLEGAIPSEKLAIRAENFYEKSNIEPVLGKRVTRIDVDARQVIIDETPNGGKKNHFDYDRLLIATGADARPIKAEGLSLNNIFYMRGQADVRAMLKTLPSAKKALVLGGGLVGFKAAYGLMRRGIEVTMLIKSGYPLSMQIDEPGGKLVLKELVSHGLDVRVGAEVKAFEGNSRVKEAYLSDGSVLQCDMVVIGKGVLPSLAFVPRDRIRVDLGIVVDKHLETSVPGIFAAGDVAEYVDIARKIPWVNAIWPEAVNQGRLAAMNMAGRKVACKGSLSRNVIRIFDVDVMTCGIVEPPADSGHQVITKIEPRKNFYRKMVFDNNVLVGMVMVNNIAQGGIFVSLIQSETPLRVPKENLLNPGFNYKQLLNF
ncbi:MAG: FAD-dependent oxidoreductase [Desulfobacterales bacterium]